MADQSKKLMSKEPVLATDGTLERWRKRRSNLVVVGAFLAVVLIEVVLIYTTDLRIVGVASTVLVCVVVFMYLVYMKSSHRLEPGIEWAGYGHLYLFALREANLDHDVRSASDRRLRFWTQNRGAIGGRIEVSAIGVRWSIGRISRLAGVSGEVYIPWSSVQKVQVGTVPGTVVRKSGGGMSITLNDGHQLHSQFIGSKGDLLRVLTDLRLNERRADRHCSCPHVPEAWDGSSEGGVPDSPPSWGKIASMVKPSTDPDDLGSVVIKRRNILQDVVRSYAVFIDGVIVGKIWAFQTKVFTVVLGPHELQLKIVNTGKSCSDVFKINVSPGNRLVFRTHARV